MEEQPGTDQEGRWFDSIILHKFRSFGIKFFDILK